MQPKLIVHGGLGTKASFARGTEEARASLRRIAEESYAFLQTHTALETAVHATSLLEDDELFNAGTGSKLQSDGVIRLTASVMDGARQRFAGVINIQAVKNPVQIAARLLQENDRVLAGEEALRFARAHGFPPHNPETPRRRAAFEARQHAQNGTVGAVAFDGAGHLAAATSTGGKGNEIPGRVSDCATVAGNYANAEAGVSCTGIGEDIVNFALAARIVMRVTDGMALRQAGDQTLAELKAAEGSAGFIALDKNGVVYQAATEPYLTYALHDGVVRVF